MKKSVSLFNTLILLLGAVFLCGCSTLSYSGEDYSKENIKSITTSESLYFSTYQKMVTDGVSARAGVTKTQLGEVLAIYLEIQNNTDKDFYINPSDITITSNGQNAAIINTSSYISAYQSMQNETYASGQTMAATVNNFASISNNYQGTNQSILLREQNSAESSMKQMNDYISGIRAHSLSSTSTIKPAEKKYYYIFIQDDGYPINIDVRGVQYNFDDKKK